MPADSATNSDRLALYNEWLKAVGIGSVVTPTSMPVAKANSMRCGTSWADANSKCGTPCPKGAESGMPEVHVRAAARTAQHTTCFEPAHRRRLHCFLAAPLPQSSSNTRETVWAFDQAGLARAHVFVASAFSSFRVAGTDAECGGAGSCFASLDATPCATVPTKPSTPSTPSLPAATTTAPVAATTPPLSPRTLDGPLFPPAEALRSPRCCVMEFQGHCCSLLPACSGFTVAGHTGRLLMRRRHVVLGSVFAGPSWYC